MRSGKYVSPTFTASILIGGLRALRWTFFQSARSSVRLGLPLSRDVHPFKFIDTNPASHDSDPLALTAADDKLSLAVSFSGPAVAPAQLSERPSVMCIQSKLPAVKVATLHMNHRRYLRSQYGPPSLSRSLNGGFRRAFYLLSWWYPWRP